MTSNIKSSSGSLKFGDLLIALELISKNDLADALKVAPQFGLPIGRTLVLSGFLSDEELQLVVELQPLIISRSVTLEKGREAARLVRKEKVSPSEALKRIGVESVAEKATIGSLLLESGAITQSQLETAKKVSYTTGMRLGRVLLLNGFITHPVLTKALNLQQMVRERKISIEQALTMLSTELTKQTSLPVKLEANSLTPQSGKKHVRFGEFLVLSGLATESEILNALEISMERQQSLGEAIVNQGLISTSLYDRAMDLYVQVSGGECGLQQATDEIHKLVFGKEEARSVPGAPVLGELLKMTGFVTDADIAEAVELSNKYPSLIGKMLVISGAIDEATLIASLRCQYLLKHGLISLDEAVRSLQYSRDMKVSLDDALDELGIRKLTEAALE